MPSAHKLKEISCLMTCHSFNGHAGHETVIWILERLRNYSWDAKAVIALAAFAMDYGEPWRLSLLQHASDSTILEVHLFKFGTEEKSRQAYDVQFTTLVDPTLQLIKGIIELEGLINDKAYSRKEVPTLYTVQRETYTYWAIFALLTCASRITELDWGVKTSEIVRKINLELTNLNIVLQECKAQIDALKDYKWRLSVFQNPSGVLELLKTLIYPRHYTPLNIYDDHSKSVVPLDVLKSRHLLLFISPLDNVEDEIWVLKTIDKTFRRDKDKHDHSILWVPIVENWNEENKAKYDYLRSKMPWYVTKYPSLVKGIKPLREEWLYQDKPIVVVVNPRGEVINKNAMHMIFVWKIEAFPFHSDVDERLSQHWRWFWNEAIQLNQSIGSWIKDDHYIFIYEPPSIPGSKYIEAPLESIKRDHITRIADVSIQYYNLREVETSKFWDNITNSFLSKIMKEYSAQDPTLRDLEKLLTLRNANGWILFSKGNNVLALDEADIISKVLAEYGIWKLDVVQKQGFDNAFLDHYRRKSARAPRSCSNLQLKNIRSGEIPLNVYCPDAACMMKMEIASINYSCCHGEHFKHGPTTEIGDNVHVPVEK
ncbi:hypothetical protein L6164_025766 [Bauhinia variegata]|nr:hypothetical protein L6164_025766 [Bauhinia variegata]